LFAQNSYVIQIGRDGRDRTVVALDKINDIKCLGLTGTQLSEITGSGKRGRVLKSDVRTHTKSKLSQVHLSRVADGPQVHQALPDMAKYGVIHREAMSGIQKITCTNMQRSWNTIPHAWLYQDIDITEAEAGRQKLKLSIKGLTMTALIIKAMAHSLKQFPRFQCRARHRKHADCIS